MPAEAASAAGCRKLGVLLSWLKHKRCKLFAGKWHSMECTVSRHLRWAGLICPFTFTLHIHQKASRSRLGHEQQIECRTRTNRVRLISDFVARNFICLQGNLEEKPSGSDIFGHYFHCQKRALSFQIKWSLCEMNQLYLLVSLQKKQYDETTNRITAQSTVKCLQCTNQLTR